MSGWVDSAETTNFPVLASNWEACTGSGTPK